MTPAVITAAVVSLAFRLHDGIQMDPVRLQWGPKGNQVSEPIGEVVFGTRLA
jgi:hypothetical protein